MGMYRKTSLTEAYQFPFADDVPQEFKDAVQMGLDISKGHDGEVYYFISTVEGDMDVVHGSWVAKGVENEFWPIKESIFQVSYEKVR